MATYAGRMDGVRPQGIASIENKMPLCERLRQFAPELEKRQRATASISLLAAMGGPKEVADIACISKDPIARLEAVNWLRSRKEANRLSEIVANTTYLDTRTESMEALRQILQ